MITSLILRGVSKQYGDTLAVAPTSFEIAKGEFVTLLGPSGCGKSTLLRIVSGITSASAGEIVLDGQRIDILPPEKRDVAMVFQSYALFPHMTVRKNLMFGLRMKKVAPSEQARRIEHAVDICNLTGLLDRMPSQLSGGQQQRVALARAIVMQPALLLFDEPLSNLDAKLRESLREELMKLHRSAGTTSLYVTHDQAEAMAMSDRILVMNGGRVVESGTPVELYKRPTEAFTAQFLGQTNLLRLPILKDSSGLNVQLPWGGAAAVDQLESGASVAMVSIRPEDIALSAQADGVGEISSVSFAGSQVSYEVNVAGVQLRVVANGGAQILSTGDRVTLQGPATIRALRAGVFA